MEQLSKLMPNEIVVYMKSSIIIICWRSMVIGYFPKVVQGVLPTSENPLPFGKPKIKKGPVVS